MRKNNLASRSLKLKIDQIHNKYGICNICLPCLFEKQRKAKEPDFFIGEELLKDLERFLGIENINQIENTDKFPEN